MAASKRSSTTHRKRTNASARKRGGVWHVNNVPGGSRSMLRRVVCYGEKFCGLWSRLRAVKDGRLKPRVTAGQVAAAYVLLMLVRLGSLNALEQRKPPRAWTRWLDGALPSADVMGDVAATLRVEQLRAIIEEQHRRRKRNKGFGRDRRGLRYLILDGHEGVSSFRRRWKDCLERLVHFTKGDRTQYYYRYVGAYLTNGKERLLLDAEEQWPGEGEMACALRLLARVLERYPRAFDVVSGDNLYMNPELWKLVRSHNKHLIAVLKNENRDLLEDARSLLAHATPVSVDGKHVRRTCRDLHGFTTWPQCGEPVRVVQSLEETTIHRQLSREDETVRSEWFWVTSLPVLLADTATIVRAGHGRWDIENFAFNELGNQWHGDHAYKYDTHALLACTLLLFIAYNLFHAFVERNLKPEAKQGRTEKYWAGLIAGEFATVFHSCSAPP